MFQVKQQLKKREEVQIRCLLQELTDSYRDFYLTKNNLRIFIQDNFHLLFKSLKRGDWIAFNEKGLAIVTGYSDKSTRKYLKILTKDDKTTDGLIKILLWHIKQPLFIKIKINNPIKKVLFNNKFKFFHSRGRELLLIRESNRNNKRIKYNYSLNPNKENKYAKSYPNKN